MNIERLRTWNPPENWVRITVVDAHAEGEPLRVIAHGYPPLPGATILEKRRAARRADHLRTALMWEPRGHADMYGCIVTDPVTPGSDFGVLFLHNEGYSTMCGHGIIAVSTVAVQTGMVDAANTASVPLKIDTPAGLVTSRVRMRADGVASVSFDNVPSFVVAMNQRIAVPTLGSVRYDLAFGGAFYAMVDSYQLGLENTPGSLTELIQAGRLIKSAISKAREIRHPFEADLSFLYGVIFTDGAPEDRAHSRNVCVFADGEVDRSPTGTGVSARAAILAARGEIEIGEPVTIESILGTRFTVSVREQIEYGGYNAIIPTVTGRAFLTGRSEFWLDPLDPLRNGFCLR